ncbi:hypothetical protein [Rhizobium calliandrae]|uniref:hypothetical protein n=1 Tax=Rhizobium calliandrae TaxID=1312182 RepID=UPI003D80ADEE
MLSSRKWSAFDIYRAFGVLPSTVGIREGSTFNSSAEEGRALVARCLRPLGNRSSFSMMPRRASLMVLWTFFMLPLPRRQPPSGLHSH